MKLKVKKSITLLIISAVILTFFIITKPFKKTIQDDPYIINDVNNKLVLSLPIKSGEGTIAYTPNVEDMERFGPESFAVSDDGTVYILDSVDEQVEIFDKFGSSIDTVELPKDKTYYDIEIRNNGSNIVVAGNGNILEYNNKCTLINEGRHASDYKFCSLHKNKNGNIVIRNVVDGTETNIDTKEVYNQYE